MNKIIVLVVAALWMAGCMTKQQATSPKQEPKGKDTVKIEGVRVGGEMGVEDDAPAPEVTGYGHDPGEETQE